MTRQKFEKVKSKGTRESSRRWLSRHINDPYVIASKNDGYRSRAAYKILEIHEKYKIFKKNDVVIDLGAAPGGWSQVVKDIIEDEGILIAVDILPMEPIVGVDIMQLDFYDPTAPQQIADFLTERGSGATKAHVVMSDIAPNTTGNKATDHLRIMGLCEAVFTFAQNVLEPGGSMIVKIFQGGAESSLLSQFKKRFRVVKHFKPDSSRKESSEMYVVAMGFR